MSVTTPPERECQVIANIRVVQAPANNRVFQVPDDE